MRGPVVVSCVHRSFAMTPRDERTVDELVIALARSRGAALDRLIDQLSEDDRSGVVRAVSQARARELARKREKNRLHRLYKLERDLRSEGYHVVAGIDEVGRGALAGPLTACACVLPPLPHIDGLDDSKRLSPDRRTEIAEQIRGIAVCWSIGHVTPAEIDALGMTAALRRSMGRALAGLCPQADHVIVDGLPIGVDENETAVVKGDSKVAAVAAASILAKVERDGLMVALSDEHPEYGFAINKGYGTPEHLAAISRVGLSAAHRLSFSAGGGTGTLF